MNRRNKLYLDTPAERAIREAAKEIEKLGCDVRLTDALNLLWKSKNLVSDVIEEYLSQQHDKK